MNKIGTALLIAGLSLSLAACGRRGAPEPPPGVNNNHAPSYLNEVTSGRLDSHNATDQDQDPSQPSNAPTAKKPRPFLLDPML